jgi:hypothetical protein
MASLIQDLTYYLIDLSKQRKELQSSLDKATKRDWQSYYRGGVHALNSPIAKLKQIIQKEERRQARSKTPVTKKKKGVKPQKLTKGMIDKFQYL